MEKPRRAAQARAALDERFASFPPAATLAPPVRGWVKAIREALGMSTEQLGKRAQIRQSSVVALEQSEAKGTIEIATLRRIAEALDCQLVYALVPNKPLEQTVRERAHLFAKRRRGPIEHSMALEDQKARSRRADSIIDEIIRDTNPARLWDEP
jgi:predicted DNA-binding mobile mystery protein A